MKNILDDCATPLMQARKQKLEVRRTNKKALSCKSKDNFNAKDARDAGDG